MNPGASHLDKERLERLLGIGLRALEKYEHGMFRMNAPGACGGEAVCRVSREGECAVGRAAERFTLMSAVKPFLLLRLLDLQGEAQVAEWVDDVPSALPYFSLDQLQADGGKPRNAMINSGAMLLASKLPGRTPLEQEELFLAWLQELAPGARFAVDVACLADVMRREGDPVNAQLAQALGNNGRVAAADSAYEVYFRICCLAGTIRDVAKIGYSLAVSASPHRERVLSTMARCGLYEGSERWFITTGIPAKSGVSGVLFGVWPDEGCVAACSPWLEEGGNPIFPQIVLAGVRLG